MEALTGQERWQATIEGAISGSFVISRSVLYAGATFLDTGVRQGGVIAFDTRDGHELWRYTIGGETATSPVLVDRLLIFGSDDDKVYAVDTSVAEDLWTYDAGAPLDPPPIAADGTVYIGDATGTFHALNAADGELLWKLKAGERERILPLTYTTLTSAYAVGDTVYFANVLEGPVYAVDTDTGNERWRFATTSLMTPVPTAEPGERDASIVSSPPTVAGDTVYVGISFGPLGIPVPDRIGYLYALDAATGRERWKVQVETQVVGRPIVQGNTIYYAANAGIIHAADTSTGADRWRFEADSPVNAPLLLSEDTLYFGTLGGTFYALR